MRAGACEYTQDYPFSTLHGLLGPGRLLIPVESDDTLMLDVESTLEWLNRPPIDHQWDCVRNALRKTHFKLAKYENSKAPNWLEFDML